MDNLLHVLCPIEIALCVSLYLINTHRGMKAIHLCNECLILFDTKAPQTNENIFRISPCAVYVVMFYAFCIIPDFTNAIKYGKKLLDILHQCGEKATERVICATVAEMYQSQCSFVNAKELYERAISITIENDAVKEEAYVREKLGEVLLNLGEYMKAKECFEKAVAITTNTGDRKGEAVARGGLGVAFCHLNEYVIAEKHTQEALSINIELVDRDGEAACYENLGSLFIRLSKHAEAKAYLEKGLEIRIEIGDQRGEALCC